MIVYLPKYLNKSHEQAFNLDFIEDRTQQNRLPSHLVCPYSISGFFKVKQCSNFWLLSIEASGILQLTCQRCLHSFSHHWQQHIEVAVCLQDEIAQQLMTDYETLVMPDLKINFSDIIIDELHFSLPEKHFDDQDCIFA